MIDDPAVAAWTPVGTAIVCDVRLGVEALLRRPDACRRDHRRAAASHRQPSRPATHHHRLPDADARRRAPADSILVEESPSSRAAMQAHLPIERPAQLLHVRERRAGP